jgi:SAM-dependent methyltransferase
MLFESSKNILRPYKRKLARLLGRSSGRAPELANPAFWLTPYPDLAEFPSENDGIFSYNRYEIPIPNPVLRSTVSEADLGKFLYIGAAWAAVCQKYLPNDRRAFVLDMGCGVGKTARFLALNPLIDYCGFDIFMPSIVWCKREFPKITGDRFRFEHFDGISAMYNPKGTIPSAEYVFPVADDSVDLAFAASLFTHLYEEDARHYFQETFRVLKKGGVALFSIHSFEDVPLFFPDARMDSSMHTMGNENVMLVSKESFADLGGSSGLKIKEAIGRVCGQETIVFEKR